ncbi:ATP-grasp domain-containing protein, partial [Thiocapsa sp. UBA6158]|uniref:ATP-grasp domain-containing protein n=1 Tax=Thiocapsa sp. UBA6158 TaxID=1947692 RepID=UPI0025E2A25D
CEWRCYVAGGRLLWRERYDHDGADDAPDPDSTTIDGMIAAHEADEAPPAGYALDVGVLSDGETALVEVNDGYALGYYGRVTPARACAYLGLLAARYVQMLL